MKKIVCIIAIVAMTAGWLLVGKDFFGSMLSYSTNISQAERSVDSGLYEQGVEYYNKALAIKEDKTIYIKIKDAYSAFYREQDNTYSYKKYIESLEKCCSCFPYSGEMWEELVTRYYEGRKFREAFDAIKKAVKNNVATEKTLELRKEISHMYQVDYMSIADYRLGRDNSYSVTDGTVFWNTNFQGESLGLEYSYVGPMDRTSRAVFVDNAGSNIRDILEITRIKLKMDVEESGYFDSGFVPVKTDGRWIYLNEDGENAELGVYDMAYSMMNFTGAVKKGNVWSILDVSDQGIDRGEYNDIAVDKYCCHTDGEHYIAADGDKYAVYSFKGEKLVDLENVEEVNVGDYSELFAFKDKSKKLWGFMDYSGKVVIEPIYAKAKGFSNNYAAVCDSDGLWAVIDEDGTQITDFEFFYIGYFTPEINCMVSRTEGAMGVFTFSY